MPSLLIMKMRKNSKNTRKEPRKRGRGDAIKILAQQLMDSEIPSCRDRVVTVPTVTEKNNELMKAGRDENEKRDKELASGRKEDRPEPTEYVKAWAYLMELYDKAKVEETKYSRYTTPPPHLVGKLITSDSAFLQPHSSGAGAGKEDLQEAMRQIKRNREEAKSGEEG